MRPLALDLCTGRGGWAKGLIAAGWDVIGVDTKTFEGNPARVILCDVRRFNLVIDPKPLLVVASPPCEEYSRHSMPWTRKKNPPPPDKTIWRACERIADRYKADLILENVRGAQAFMGKANMCVGAFYLWGNTPPHLPIVEYKKKESFGSKQRAERAEIPFELALAIGKSFLWRLAP